MPPPSRTSRIVLFAVAAIIIVAGYFWLRWWTLSGERAPTAADTQSFSEPEKLQVLQELSAGASTTASPQEKAKVLQALQQSNSRAPSTALSEDDRSAVLQALRTPN